AHRDGSVRRVAPAYSDRIEDALVRAFPESSPRVNWTTDPNPLSHAIRSARPVLVPEVTGEWLRAFVPDDIVRRRLEEFPITSLVVVPLVARGLTLGGMVFGSRRRERPYGETDLGFAADLAARAALAIDNARLFRKVERAATDAQQASRAKDEFLA